VNRYEGGLGAEFEAFLHRIDDREAAEARRGLRALALAPTLALCQALLRGEQVPLEQLRQDAVRRYGLRP
jgi:hypothetical protein